MIFELLELISAAALLLIAIQLTLLVRLKGREAKFAVVQRTHEEIYRNERYRRLMTEVASRSKGSDWDEEKLREAGLNFGSAANNVFEGNKGFYLRVPQTRIVNVTGVFQLGPT